MPVSDLDYQLSMKFVFMFIFYRPIVPIVDVNLLSEIVSEIRLTHNGRFFWKKVHQIYCSNTKNYDKTLRTLKRIYDGLKNNPILKQRQTIWTQEQCQAILREVIAGESSGVKILKHQPLLVGKSSRQIYDKARRMIAKLK